MKLFSEMLAKARSYRGEQYYPFIVVTQIMIIVQALLLEDVLITAEVASASAIRDLAFMLTGGAYLLLNWSLFSRLVHNSFWSYTVLLILVIELSMITLLLNPFAPLLSTDLERQPYLMGMHVVLFMVEIGFIVFCIYDIFSQGTAVTDKLWGAACVYLMIGISFGSLYDIICIWKPSSLGKYFSLGIASYTECIAYSMTVISGIDAPHENPNDLIKNISIMEAIWSNLFVMILVGRLLGLPSQENK